MSEYLAENEEEIIDEKFFDRFKTPSEKEKMISLFKDFRTQVNDADAELNILNDKKIENSNIKILNYFKRAIRDLNSGAPITKYEITNFPDEGLLVEGAVIFYLVANGILQLRNQVDFNDSGLSIGLFNKTQLYQGWLGFLLQSYTNAKAEFKAATIAKNQPSMFIGVGSEYANYWW